jgi:enamine deaminase RidA (YjgF/YER057c/UK114 family)
MDGPTRPRVTLVQASGVAETTAPYSHVLIVEAGRLLFISGQGPVDAQGYVVGTGDPQAQVRQVFANIQAPVEAAGGSPADIVERDRHGKSVAC